MSYTKRTCNKCGIRKPQPEMVRKTETSMSVSTNFQRKNSTRFYGRPKTVWYCRSCANSSAEGWAIITVIGFVVYLGYMVYSGITGV